MTPAQMFSAMSDKSAPGETRTYSVDVGEGLLADRAKAKAEWITRQMERWEQ